MTTLDKEIPEGQSGRVLTFPDRLRRRTPPAPTQNGQAVEDLSRFEAGDGADDYRRRMIVNVIAFAFIGLLTWAGIWLADAIAMLRKNHDCAMSGGRICEIDRHIRH